jgi:hypothetical protein
METAAEKTAGETAKTIEGQNGEAICRTDAVAYL